MAVLTSGSINISGSVTVNPNIVVNGIILHYDFANSRSYVSGSSTVTDLSISRNNGTLSGSAGTRPTFISDGGGSLSFSGRTNDQYVQAATKPTPPTGSWEYWVSPDTSSIVAPSNWALIGATDGAVRVYHTVIGYEFAVNTTNQGWYGPVIGWDPPGGVHNKWAHVVCVFDGLTNLALYINGDVRFSPAIATGTVNGYGPASPHRLAGAPGFGGSWFRGKIALHRVYNRALSSSEVLYNYNSTKGRFGL